MRQVISDDEDAPPVAETAVEVDEPDELEGAATDEALAWLSEGPPPPLGEDDDEALLRTIPVPTGTDMARVRVVGCPQLSGRSLTSPAPPPPLSRAAVATPPRGGGASHPPPPPPAAAGRVAAYRAATDGWGDRSGMRPRGTAADAAAATATHGGRCRGRALGPVAAPTSSWSRWASGPPTAVAAACASRGASTT